MADDQRHWHDQMLKVLVNGHGAYSIWPSNRESPAGWTATGTTGSRATCLEYVREHWKDLRRVDSITTGPDDPAPDIPEVADIESDLVGAPQNIRTERTQGDLREALDLSYLHLVFPDLPDSPRIGIHLTHFEDSPDLVSFTGDLLLNGRHLICDGQIQWGTLNGNASLSVAEKQSVSN